MPDTAIQPSFAGTNAACDWRTSGSESRELRSGFSGANRGNLTYTKPNAMRPDDAAVHDWYRFVLSFPPHLVADYVNRFGLSSGHLLLDPFCGTGTTLVEAKKRKVPSVGVEAMPLTAFVARTKVDWSCDADLLEYHAKSVALSALGRLERQGIADSPPNDPIEPDTLMQFSPDQQRLVFNNAISPLPLHKALVLKDAIERDFCAGVIQHERLALASTVVNSASNLKFGPEVGVGKVKTDAAVVSEWLTAIGRMAEDLRRNSENGVRSVVHEADARSLGSPLPERSIDAVITSPPYPNEKDYTRTVRLESVLLGFFRDRSHLREVKEDLLRSNTRNVFKGDTDSELVKDQDDIVRLASLIEQRRVELGKTSGFERRYAQVTMEYFGGMVRHLRSLSRVLKPGALLAYVVGDQASYFRILIQTGKLLERLAESEGYHVEGRELFRTRPATVTGELLREEVLVLRAPNP